MTEIQAAHALRAAVFLLILFLFWHLCWRRLALDWLRQELFAIRDRLFDVAAESSGTGFGFNHPAYGALRSQFNASIRFAHHVSTVQVLVFVALRRIFEPDLQPEPPTSERARTLLGDVDCSVQAEVESILTRFKRAIILFLAATSPLFYATIAFAVLRAIKACVAPKMLGMRETVRQAAASYPSAVWAEAALEKALNDSPSKFQQLARAV